LLRQVLKEPKKNRQINYIIKFKTKTKKIQGQKVHLFRSSVSFLAEAHPRLDTGEAKRHFLAEVHELQSKRQDPALDSTPLGNTNGAGTKTTFHCCTSPRQNVVPQVHRRFPM
jgi:hypothetical protein